MRGVDPGVELRPVIHELEVANDLRSYSVKRRCWVAFNLSEEVTGFQDIQFHVDQSGSKWELPNLMHIELTCLHPPVMSYTYNR